MVKQLAVVVVMCAMGLCAFAQKKPLKRIVIDPGHGGSAAEARDFYGASGKHMEEKDVALAIGLKLQKLINQEIPDVDVVMTRTTDEFNSPYVKADKANAVRWYSNALSVTNNPDLKTALEKRIAELKK